MQDGTQEGDEAYIILHRGARSMGYNVTREREREFGLGVSRLSWSPLRSPSPSPLACVSPRASP
jgi:hypothetical protein